MMTYRLTSICLTLTLFMGCADNAGGPAPPEDVTDSQGATDSPSDVPPADIETPGLPTPGGGEPFAATHQISVPTEYYTGGPQQGRPPDGTFESGTKVRLMEAAGSYSLIESDSGIQAYVAADALVEIE